MIAPDNYLILLFYWFSDIGKVALRLSARRSSHIAQASQTRNRRRPNRRPDLLGKTPGARRHFPPRHLRG